MIGALYRSLHNSERGGGPPPPPSARIGLIDLQLIVLYCYTVV